MYNDDFGKNDIGIIQQPHRDYGATHLSSAFSSPHTEALFGGSRNYSGISPSRIDLYSNQNISNPFNPGHNSSDRGYKF